MAWRGAWRGASARLGSRVVDERLRTNRTGIAASVIGLILLLFVVALVFDLGPFADDELSAPEFLSRGDEICTRAHDEFLEIQTSTPRTAAEAESISAALIEVAEEELDSIRDLGEPAALTEPLERYLGLRAEGIDVLREGQEAASGDDPVAYERSQAELARTQPKRAKAAREVGFNECSEPLIGPDELERQARPPSSE